jgi:hypothetical protein
MGHWWLLYLLIRVIYALVAVCTQRRELGLVYGTVAVRVLLIFLHEALLAWVIIAVGLLTRRRLVKA